MNIDKIPLGDNLPYEFNVVVEIPQGGHPVKYELDKASGAMFVDRFLNTSMTYPANYGFIPHTLAADGDPCDVLVLDRSPVVPGAIIKARPIGALVMTDEAGADDKIIAVPVDELNPYYGHINAPEDLSPRLKDQVAHFFQHYKDLEKGKWVAGLRWVGYEAALALIVEGIQMGPLGKKTKLPPVCRELMAAHPRGAVFKNAGRTAASTAAKSKAKTPSGKKSLKEAPVKAVKKAARPTSTGKKKA